MFDWSGHETCTAPIGALQKASVGLLRTAWHFAAMTDPETLPLAAGFPTATREEWRKLVDAVLKGAPFERLVSTTYDGLAIEPLAQRRSDARTVAGRPGARQRNRAARTQQRRRRTCTDFFRRNRRLRLRTSGQRAGARPHARRFRL